MILCYFTWQLLPILKPNKENVLADLRNQVSQIIKQLIYYTHDFSKEGSCKLWAMLPEKIKLSRITFLFLLNKIYQNLHSEELYRIN